MFVIYYHERLARNKKYIVLLNCSFTSLRYHSVLSLSASSSKEAQTSEAVMASTSTSVAASASSEKKRRSDIAAQRKARIMMKMASMQQNFIKTNETLFQVG